MDYAFEFEKVINEYIGRPKYITYSIYWNYKNKRTALLFTACVKLYDENSTGEIEKKIRWFKEELFNEKEKEVSTECLAFLKESIPLIKK